MSWLSRIVVAVYASVVLASIGRQPLWVDEILQLIGTRDRSFREMLGWVALNPGAAPLGYLPEWALLHVMPFSEAAARLPAALFGIGSCVVVAMLAAKLCHRQAWLAVLVFAALPQQFRYSVEARPYSQAVFLSALATLQVACMRERESRLRWVAYVLTLTAAVYTQPLTWFVAAGHGMWAVWLHPQWRLGLGRRVWMATICAALAFAPWFLCVRSSWQAAIAGSGFVFDFTPLTLLMLFREFSGLGLVGGTLLAYSAWLGWQSDLLDPAAKRLLLWGVAAPLFGALGADAAFGYFVAVRQFVFILPAMTVLAAAGLASLQGRRPIRATAGIATLVALGFCGSWRTQNRPHEDWAIAAQILRSKLGGGGCVAVAPFEWQALYDFFEPDLSRASCGGALAEEQRVVLAITPYTHRASITRAHRDLLLAGFRRIGSESAGGTTIELFSRRRGPPTLL